MKLSNIFIAICVSLSMSCGPEKAQSDHGHEHGAEDSGHSHDSDGGHIEQEEFSASTDSIDTKSASSQGAEEASIDTSEQANEVTVVVPANKGVEYKFYLKQYEKLAYEWTSDAPLYFDLHGEPLDYAVSKYFESFAEATADKMKGTLTVPFEGSHGWYWKNSGEKPVSVILKTKGNYKIIGLK